MYRIFAVPLGTSKGQSVERLDGKPDELPQPFSKIFLNNLYIIKTKILWMIFAT